MSDKIYRHALIFFIYEKFVSTAVKRVAAAEILFGTIPKIGLVVKPSDCYHDDILLYNISCKSGQ